MKKILALILAALMVLTMVACAAKAEPAADAEQTTDGTGCLGNTSTFDVKGKIRRKKPVMQKKLRENLQYKSYAPGSVLPMSPLQSWRN